MPANASGSRQQAKDRPPFEIRPARHLDAAALYAIHSGVLPDDLLTRLGSPCFSRVFFPAIIGCEAFTSLVIETPEAVQGYIVIANHDQAMRRAILDGLVRSIRLIVVELAQRPSTLAQVLCYLHRRLDLSPDGERVLAHPHREIVAFALNPRAHGHGWAVRLLQQALSRAPIPTVPLVACTDAAAALKFYAKHGFYQIGIQHRCSRVLAMLCRN